MKENKDADDGERTKEEKVTSISWLHDSWCEVVAGTRKVKEEWWDWWNF
jgi:hypothetical protein